MQTIWIWEGGIIDILFGKYKGVDIGEIPDTYLDYLLGERWFLTHPKNQTLIPEIQQELATRQRSRCYVPDQYGKTLEDI